MKENGKTSANQEIILPALSAPKVEHQASYHEEIANIDTAIAVEDWNFADVADDLVSKEENAAAKKEVDLSKLTAALNREKSW